MGRLLGLQRAVLGWVMHKPVMRGGILGGVLASVIGSAIISWLVFPSTVLSPDQKLSAALEMLDAGDFASARQLAAELRTDPEVTDAKLAGPMFVLGSVMAHDAAAYADPRQREILFRVAARYFEEARNRGLPADREGEGLYLFGYSLLEARRFAYATEVLREALTVDPQPRATEVHRLLALAYLGQDPSLPGKATREIAAYLQDSTLSPRERDAGLLWIARVQLQAADLLACRAAVEQIAAETPLRNERLLIEGELLIAEGDQLRGTLKTLAVDSPAGMKYNAALQCLKEVQSRDGADLALMSQSLLFQATIHERLGEFEEAERLWVRIRRQYFGSAEALASTVRLGELLVRVGRPFEGLPLLRRGIAEATAMPVYENPWLSRAEFETHLQEAYQTVLAAQQFETAIAFAEAWTPFLPPDQCIEARSLAHKAWAAHFEEQVVGKGAVDREAILASARAQYRLLGEVNEELAELRQTTSHFENDLWASAEGYFKGQAYRAATRQCRAFLAAQSSKRRPDALATLGECLLAQGEYAEAVQVFQLCLEEYPRHPASYRSRLKSAQALQELGRMEDARQLLIDNLYNHALTPRSPEWRDSLFALGETLYRAGLEQEATARLAGVGDRNEERNAAGFAAMEQGYSLFQEAIQNLSEAVRRFPNAPQTISARYRIAESLRHSARFARQRLGMVTIETTRVALHRQLQHDLTAAEEAYATLLQQIDDDQQGQYRSPVELAIIRNSYFGRADALFDLARYEDAVNAYSAATNRYQTEPEALEAYVQIAACYRRLNRYVEARGTVEQARIVLNRIRSDANFKRTTRFTRDEWGQVIDWLATL